MTRWYRYLALAGGLVIVTATIAFASGRTGVAQEVFRGLTAFIVNDSENPVPVAPVRVFPVQSSGGPFHAQGHVLPTFQNFYFVPDGSRALIRFVSGNCTGQVGTSAQYVVLVTANVNPGDTESTVAEHTFPLVPTGASRWAFAQDTFIHAQAQSAIQAAVAAGLQNVQCEVTVSGEYFPVGANDTRQ